MKLLKFLIGLVVLLVLLLFVAGFFADSIAKTAIEEGGTFALGVDTTVESVSLGLLKGTFSMDDLAVANPKGYGEAKFLELGSGAVEVSAASLLSEKIEVPTIDLSRIRVQLVQGAGGSNYGTILDNLERLQSGSGSDADSGEGKRFIIEKLTLSDILVEVVPVPELGLAAVKVPIDEIVLEDIGSESDEGVLLSDLAGIVVEAILKRASATGQLPSQIQGALDGQLRQLSGLAEAGIGAGLDAAKDALNEGLKGFGIGR